MADFIAEILCAIAEPILEAVIDGVVDSAHYLIPGKRLSGKAKRVIAYVICFVGLAMLISLIFGIIILVDDNGQSLAGWIMVFAAIGYTLLLILLRIAAGIFRRVRARKAEKLNEYNKKSDEYA